MDPNAGTKIIKMLDALADGVGVVRQDVGRLSAEVNELRAEVNEFRADVNEFRAETSANFNRIERRLTTTSAVSGASSDSSRE